MTAKKTTKKTAKKTYPSAKKTTLPKLKKKSEVDKLAAILAESQAKMAESQAKTETAIRELFAENRKISAEMAKNHAKTEAVVAETSAEVKSLAAERKETWRLLQDLTVKINMTTANVNRLSDNVGSVNNRLGRIVELVVAPKIRYDINTVGGHNFSHVETNTLIRGIVGGRKEDIAEVDVLLRGTTEVMAVELKARLRENHVRDHVDRLQDLRDHEEEADIKGKTLLGAVGGIVIDEKAKKLAKRSGLYIIAIREEKEAIDIEKPETCRAW